MLFGLFNKYSELEAPEKVELEYSAELPAISSHEEDSSNLLTSQPPRKKPSADAPLRWLAMTVYTTVMLFSVVTLIVLMITRSNLL